MWHIIFPQAIRNVIPSLGNEFVTIVKESSIVSILGIYDIKRVSDVVKASTLKVIEALVSLRYLLFHHPQRSYLIINSKTVTFAKR